MPPVRRHGGGELHGDQKEAAARGPHKPHHPPGGIELSGNTRAVVEGCKGILEYEDDVIRLNTASGIIRFMGQNLGMNCLNEDSAVVEGKILSVEFMS